MEPGRTVPDYALNVQASAGNYSWEDKKTGGAAFVQDNWRITENLTVNLGLRYDVSVGAKSEQHTFEPFLPEPRPTEKLNFQPRLGFAYSLADERTVFRGGFGKDFAELTGHQGYSLSITRNAAGVVIPNDGRADFAANPWMGPTPTYGQVLTYPNRNIILSIPGPEFMSPYSWQSSVGMQRQLGETMSVQADYVYSGIRRDEVNRNANLSYDPATGANNSYLIVAARPYPEWGNVNTQYSEAWANSQSIDTALTRRFSRRWQASATYTLGWLKNAEGAPTGPCWTAATGFLPCPSGFKVPPDIGGDYTYAAGDQRHRAVFNGIWQLPYEFQVSGLYFYGSGQRYSTSYGTGLRLRGPGNVGRFRPDATIAPRNNFVGDPLHRVDLRVQRYQPRMMQLGFRLTF